MNSTSLFRDAIRAAGLQPPDTIEPGKFHRFPGIGKGKSNNAGWCKLFDDGRGGIFGDYSSGRSESWQANRDKPYSPAESEAFTRNVAESRAQAEADRKEKQAKSAVNAENTWNVAASLVQGDFPYLVRKGIQSHGTRLHKGALVIPVRDGDELQSLQYIQEDGNKRFLSGGRVTGGYFLIGVPTGVLCIAEGFATGASIHEATGHAVAVAFNSGNLVPVAKALRAKYPNLKLIVCADDDHRTEGNPGVTKATEAARAAGGVVAVPDFGPDRLDGATDFNDMAAHCGPESVRTCVDRAAVAEIAKIAVASPPRQKIGENDPGADEEGGSDVDALIAAQLSTVDAKNEVRKLRSAMAAIKLDSKAPKVKHDAPTTIGFALCTEYGDSHNKNLARALCLEWDKSTGGNSVSVFDDANPNYSYGKGPVTTNSLYKLANSSGWDGVYDSEWVEPQPLTAKVESEPYPVDALPQTVRAAVAEVQGFVKAPISLVASSALAALSLATQAHVDAKRAERLQGPVGLFLLSIADSGERKTTVDGFFVTPIREYESQQAEAMKPELERYEAKFAAWTAEREGILSAIKQAGKTGKSVEKLRTDLAALQNNKPEAPRVPRLLLGDETPENLAWSLAKKWPSAGVISSEAGLILGAHGMGADSVMRNLGLLNILWDGGVHSVGRRTSESFTVKGARLTVALQIQEATLRSFFDRSGTLARGTGFLARFLVAWPESTQGHRPFTEAPESWPHLAVFHRRIASILANPVPMDDEGALCPLLLTLTPEAKQAWIAFHDAIEAELVSGGELHDVRDVASKTADNAVRLAALFQVFEHGVGAISLDCFESGSRIAAWHLSESRRFFGELALPIGLADAARLDSWLIKHHQQTKEHSVGKNHVRQCGPLRDGARLDAAINELINLDRLRLVKDGKQQAINMNPALLRATP